MGAGASCTATVKFAPTTVGTFSGTLTVTDFPTRSDGSQQGGGCLRRGPSIGSRRGLEGIPHKRLTPVIYRPVVQESVNRVFALTLTLDHLHAKTRKALKLSPEFVLHSLRHTYPYAFGASRSRSFHHHETCGTRERDGEPAIRSPDTKGNGRCGCEAGQYERALVRISINGFRKAGSLGIYRSARSSFGKMN